MNTLCITWPLHQVTSLYLSLGQRFPLHLHIYKHAYMHTQPATARIQELPSTKERTNQPAYLHIFLFKKVVAKYA